MIPPSASKIHARVVIIPSCFYSVQVVLQQERHDEAFPSVSFFLSPFLARAPLTPVLSPSPWLAQQPNLQSSSQPSVAPFFLVSDHRQSELVPSPYLLSCRSQHKVVLDSTQATVLREGHAWSLELQFLFHTVKPE